MKMTLFLVALLSMNAAQADIRCCVDEIKRDENGKILRSAKVLREFQKLYPCPSTKLKTGPCPGWAKDHTIPLSEYGKDIIENLTWMPNEIKSCKEKWCKDRFEREVYKHND